LDHVPKSGSGSNQDRIRNTDHKEHRKLVIYSERSFLFQTAHRHLVRYVEQHKKCIVNSNDLMLNTLSRFVGV
jgi:hypothetical protein